MASAGAQHMHKGSMAKTHNGASAVVARKTFRSFNKPCRVVSGTNRININSGNTGSARNPARAACPASVAATAGACPSPPTASHAAAAHAASTASCSPSSSCNICLPMVLDPRRPNSAAVLLKAPLYPWDSAVWLARRYGDEGELVVVKQTPFHSPQRMAVARRVLYHSKVRPAVDSIVWEHQARHEAATVAQLPGIFLQPLAVLDRECSRDAAGEDETFPDREIIVVTPYFPSGDAGQYIDQLVTPLIAAFKAGKRSLDSLVKELVRVITRLAREMFSLVSQVHEQGFILVDHKLENMVYDHIQSRWQLIDAGEVRQTRGQLDGGYRITRLYAAPEQVLQEGKWTDSRSDVYTCGRCIMMAVSDCLDRLTALLGEGSKQLHAAEKGFRQALMPLSDVVKRCSRTEAAKRPTMATALHLLRARCPQ